MSIYGDTEKDYVFDEMFDFLNHGGNDVSTLLSIVSDVVSHYECKQYSKYKEQLEKEYAGYKEKVEQMKELMK